MKLRDVRELVDRLATQLDPGSRYRPELLEIIESATDVDDLRQRLATKSRGARHSGDVVFAKMSLEEQLRANLVTPETSLFRFAEGELEAIDRFLLPKLTGAVRALIVPCSHGEEAYTIAAYFTKIGVDFSIDAFDVQPALIEEAKTGVLTFGFPSGYLEAPGRVSRSILERIHFEVQDAFALEAAPAYDVVLCRNFLGYFLPEVATKLALDLADRTTGALFLDGFAVEKFPELTSAIVARGFARFGACPVFIRASGGP